MGALTFDKTILSRFLSSFSRSIASFLRMMADMRWSKRLWMPREREREDREVATPIKNCQDGRTNVILGRYFEEFHSLTEAPLEFLALQGILVLFLDAVAAVIAIGIPTTVEAKVRAETRRLGCAGAGTGVGSGKRAVGARAHLDGGLAALEVGRGMRRGKGRGRGGMGSEAREGSKAGADVGEGRCLGGWGRWRGGSWVRKPVVEGETDDIGGDGAVVVEVSLGTDDVDEKVWRTVLLEFCCEVRRRRRVERERRART